MDDSNMTVLAAVTVQYWRSEADGQFYWHAIAPENGQKMADGSQGYAHEQDCVNGAKRVTRQNAELIADPNKEG